MSMPRNPRARRAHERRTIRHEAKRRAVRNAYKPHTKSDGARIVNTMSANRQQPRGLPKLVQQAIGRMRERHKLLTMPKPVPEVEPDEKAA